MAILHSRPPAILRGAPPEWVCAGQSTGLRADGMQSRRCWTVRQPRRRQRAPRAVRSRSAHPGPACVGRRCRIGASVGRSRRPLRSSSATDRRACCALAGGRDREGQSVRGGAAGARSDGRDSRTSKVSRSGPVGRSRGLLDAGDAGPVRRRARGRRIPKIARVLEGMTGGGEGATLKTHRVVARRIYGG